ncbi:hypothetical protein [Actinokineospora xionganensis]|uniref:Uncharacterized protein n=1 Tax=Actinokineospora xionganensis TaxID=2684470 RepID=A0ABR7L3H3_9PSEU|nr:hypothetical protein [Actinokineospora xionganensis]MBC6447132.1 hypothetical protein [Actinokineospora xionganensis]
MSILERGAGGQILALTTYFIGMKYSPYAQWHPTGDRKAPIETYVADGA